MNGSVSSTKSVNGDPADAHVDVTPLRARDSLSLPRTARQLSAAENNGKSAVTVVQEKASYPTYLPAAPDKNPMFLEKRVYQGSSGRVYPLPFTDRIAEKPVNREWQGIWIENEFIRALILPELGGRIHAIKDKTTGYDLIYNQHVIKPALVGLAGPWASGGIEFNWPQHHRPATFMPVNTDIEHHADGSVTVWCSDHDPMARMKGMHGVCLHPGKSFLELKVRVYNRTPYVQTFLWWANVATRVHESYQSFFPPDVFYVADHAKRAMSEYPLAEGHYYGLNYGERGRKGIPPGEIANQFVPPHSAPHQNSAGSNGARGNGHTLDYTPNDLSWYGNIPVPTSYMCMGSREDFFGGYDHAEQAGILHVANHHISPGKKQWTWGNHELGYAWDRNLTEPDTKKEFGPYIEIMAGVYTDNQPDFSFLQPGETKTWSQYWYPISKIGPAQHANLHAAVSLAVAGVNGDQSLRVGVSVTASHAQAVVTISAGEKQFANFRCDLSPAQPFIKQVKIPAGIVRTDLQLRVTDAAGKELISYQPRAQQNESVPPPATEPPAPKAIASADELFITGLHLDQYRHATRCPSLYWREALRRDPQDARCNNAMGLWHFKRGEFAIAEKYFRAAIERLTRRNPNPYDGEAYYNLGLCLRALGRDDDAYAAFYKATWNQAWAGAGYHAVAEIDCVRGHWSEAAEHLERSLRFDTNNLRARNLKVMVLRKLAGQASCLSPIEKEKLEATATAVLCETRQLDRLDWWSRHLGFEKLNCDLQTQLDLAHDYARAGFFAEAIALLTEAAHQAEPHVHTNGNGHAKPAPLPDQSWGALPLLHYTLGWLEQKRGDAKAELKHFQNGAAASTNYCFPARLEEIAILETAIHANPKDARALYYLGNLFYDRRRHQEAIRLWEKSARLDGNFSIVWRNLGIGYFNIRNNAGMARTVYDKAFRVNPADARLLFERDQLWKRLGSQPAKRLRELEKFPQLVSQRDDLSVEICALYNQTGQHEKALALVSSRNFQPWEGGEGGPLGQWVRSHLALGRAALGVGDLPKAHVHFEAALTAPLNLGEAKHLLANQSDIHYWLGCALAQLGEKAKAKLHWQVAANFKGDFQEMSVRAFSEMTYYSALSWEKLGQKAKVKKLLRDLLAYARKLAKTHAKIDYFATSLPTMLLFDDDLQRRQEITAIFIAAQAQFGLGQKKTAVRMLQQVLQRDPNHAFAADLVAELGAKAAKAAKKNF